MSPIPNLKSQISNPPSPLRQEKEKTARKSRTFSDICTKTKTFAPPHVSEKVR
jgi:hypothetical protein